MVKFFFKKGKREEGFAELDLILNLQARQCKGFRGFISLHSQEEKDNAVIMTLWEDEESLNASERAVFDKAVNKIYHFLEKEPNVERYKVFSTELLLRGKPQKAK
jgi:heme-degrading monooxygenase HmoA